LIFSLSQTIKTLGRIKLITAYPFEASLLSAFITFDFFNFSIMKKLTIPIIFLVLIACNRKNLTEQLQSSRWIDLTHPFDSATVYWPTNVKFRHDTVFCGMTEKGYFYSSFKYSAEEHGGTHFDAPLHFWQSGQSIEQVTVDRLHGPCVLINVTSQSTVNRDYQVSQQDLEGWETAHGRIPDNSIVLLYSGFGKFWSNHLKYTGTLKSGKQGVVELHFPGLSPSAAMWLTQNRKIHSVGIDTPSIDYGQSVDFMAHRILCENGITICENLANLDQVPAQGAYIIALPMKIKGGSGSPLRIVAVAGL
jgi:kynurenine formamidase